MRIISQFMPPLAIYIACILLIILDEVILKLHITGGALYAFSSLIYVGFNFSKSYDIIQTNWKAFLLAAIISTVGLLIGLMVGVNFKFLLGGRV